MHLQTLIYVVAVAVLLSASTSSSEGLKCWVCSSLMNADCDDTFTSEVSDTILKRDCSLVPSPASSSRKVPATTCMTRILRGNGKTIVSRGCASPGDIGIEDPTVPECRVVTTPDGKGSSETCLCEGDYCNRAVTQNFATALGILLPFGFFCSWMLTTPF